VAVQEMEVRLFWSKKTAVVKYSDLILICVYSLCFYNVMLDMDMLFHIFPIKPVVLVEDAKSIITLVL
jgi:hypothetical protein